MNETTDNFSHIGIVFPTSLELQPFSDLMPELKLESAKPWDIYGAQLEQVRVSVIVSYIGPANAAAATERLISTGAQLILNGGSAGAINSDLYPGDLILGKHYKIICSRAILEARRTLLLSNKAIRYLNEGNSVHVESLEASDSLIDLATQAGKSISRKHPFWNAAGWPPKTPNRSPNIVVGTLGSQDGWTKSKEDLDFARLEFGVDSEDMESSYIAQIAAKHGLPFFAVRSISNNEHIKTLDKSEIFPAVSAAAARSAEVLASMCRRLAQTSPPS